MSDLVLPNCRPYEFKFPISRTALLLIDLQRDFLDPDGFGSVQCGDPAIFGSVRKLVPTVQRVLEKARAMGMHVVHTREGHRPELTDLPAAKRLRQISAPNGHHNLAIGDQGPMGRLLVRGEYGHDIIDELTPRPGELVIDKPGKGSYWGTSLHRDLLARGITHLIVGGVTTECCVSTTIRECHDRGYECCLLDDCTDGFDAQMVTTAMDSICAQDGLFGYIGNSSDFLAPSLQFTPSTTPFADDGSFPSITKLQRLFRTGQDDPVRIANLVFDRIEKYQQVDPAVWIYLRKREEVVADIQALATKYHHFTDEPSQDLPPLFGIPFGIQDNIDVAGLPTTAACEAYTSRPTVNAPAVQSLIDAGAIPIGKLNLDQLGKGLSGLSSPYGNPHAVNSPQHIAGGAASGSAVAVGAGLVSFALATDTTGDSATPAALNGIVSLKPTKGTVSARGTVPVCPSLDTISILTSRPEDARTVWIQVSAHDALDPYAKPFASLPTWHVDFRGPRVGGFRFAIPPTPVLESLCSKPVLDIFFQTVGTLVASGGTVVEIDYGVFERASDLASPKSSRLIQEHIAAIGPDFFTANFPTLPQTIQAAYGPFLFPEEYQKGISAPWEIFREHARVAECVQSTRQLFDPLSATGIDFLLVPTTPLHPTLEEMENSKTTESKLGVFTRAANMLDLCAVTIKAGTIVNSGLPVGVTMLGGMGYDAKVLDLAVYLASGLKARSY